MNCFNNIEPNTSHLIRAIRSKSGHDPKNNCEVTIDRLSETEQMLFIFSFDVLDVRAADVSSIDQTISTETFAVVLRGPHLSQNAYAVSNTKIEKPHALNFT